MLTGQGLSQSSGRAASLFIRAVGSEDKARCLEDAISQVRSGRVDMREIFFADARSFRGLPESSMAYWLTPRIRALFRESPRFGDDGRSVKQGLATSDDWRYLRLWSEVDAQKLLSAPEERDRDVLLTLIEAGKYWTPLAKGGMYSPFYADLPLVVNWRGDGAEVKATVCHRYPYLDGKWQWVVKNSDVYFLPGLTYPRRLHRLAPVPLPAGAIISVRGSGIYSAEMDALTALALCFSMPFDSFVKVSLGRFGHPQFDAAPICSAPVPENMPRRHAGLSSCALRGIEVARRADSAAEISHVFRLPGLLQTSGSPSSRAPPPGSLASTIPSANSARFSQR